VESVGNTENLGQLLKETRISKGITIDYLFMKTRVPKDIIKRIEDEPDFLENNTYAKIFFKQLCKELGVSIEHLEEKKETLSEKIKKLEEENELNQSNSETKGTFLTNKKIVNSVLSFSIIFSLILLSMSFKEKNTEDPFKILVNSKAVDEKETKIEKKQIKKTAKKSDGFLGKTILLKANSTVWITAVIDGKNRVITLQKGEKRLIPFDLKVVFETIGNSKSLVINYNGKEITISKEIVHNIFVDSEGIFLNGRNLLGETRNS
jgi:cytoskeletal protein RodZ